MRRRIRYAPYLSALLLFAGCDDTSGPSMICWPDFVHVNGIKYVAPGVQAGRSLGESDLRAQHATVAFRVEGNVHFPDYPSKNGDAAYLDVGTPIYRVGTYAPEFRLAARVNGSVRVYEASGNPDARFGSDLVDIDGRVDSIGIYEGVQPRAVIANRNVVESLVAEMLSAPVDRTLTPRGTLYNVTFHLRDGTDVTRAFWPTANLMVQLLAVPPEFSRTIEAAAINRERQPTSPLREVASPCSVEG